MRFVFLIAATLLYLAASCAVNAQGINDVSVSIDQSNDQDVLNQQTQSFNGETGVGQQSLRVRAPLLFTSANSTGESTLKAGHRPLPPGTAPIWSDYIYSGFVANKSPTFFTTPQFYTRDTFNEKNSFLGTGVTDSYGHDLGVDINTRTGLRIEPDFGYKYAARDLDGTNTQRANSYAGTLTFTQKVFPLAAITDDQPGATFNLREATDEDLKKLDNDIYPNMDIKLGFVAAITATNLSTLTAGSRVKTSQDAYDLSPSLTFDFALSKQFTLSLVPSYDNTMTSTSTATSSSGGSLQIQQRNTYTYVPTHGGVPDTIQSFQITEYNSLLHDTSLEPLPPVAMPIAYQNWAKFGLSLTYNRVYGDPRLKDKRHILARVEYSYEAFNAAYEAHNVIASVNIDF